MDGIMGKLRTGFKFDFWGLGVNSVEANAEMRWESLPLARWPEDDLHLCGMASWYAINTYDVHQPMPSVHLNPHSNFHSLDTLSSWKQAFISMSTDTHTRSAIPSCSTVVKNGKRNPGQCTMWANLVNVRSGWRAPTSHRADPPTTEPQRPQAAGLIAFSFSFISLSYPNCFPLENKYSGNILLHDAVIWWSFSLVVSLIYLIWLWLSWYLWWIKVSDMGKLQIF